MAKGVEIGRSFILIPTPWALMSHPHWPIFPSAFVEKTTNAKDGYTVSEANVVSKECCFPFTNCTVLFRQFVSSDGRCVSKTLFTPPRKKVSRGGRGLKTSHNCVFSLIMLLSKSIQKVYQFKSVLLWIVYTCQLDIFQSTFWQNSTIWKPRQSIFFQLRFFRLRMKEIKAIPFPPRGIRAIRTSFARLCITTNALFPSTSSLSLFSPSSETRETRQKWPHTWMKARDGRGTEKRD